MRLSLISSNLALLMIYIYSLERLGSAEACVGYKQGPTAAWLNALVPVCLAWPGTTIRDPPPPRDATIAALRPPRNRRSSTTPRVVVV
jgi:hypothetical protein